MNLFYSPQIEGNSFELDEKESKHLIRVLRMKKGDPVQLVDGKGGWFEAVIETDDPRNCLLMITSRIRDFNPLPYSLHLAVSPTKSMDRFEWFLEKATEIGITRITPLMCHRTERRQLKPDRLERILISAMKQSLKAYKPVLSEPASLDGFVKAEYYGTKGIAHCIPGHPTGITDLPRSSGYTLLVGPEGDFTDEEIKLAVEAGFTSFHLGRSRLRTETAAVYICSAISLLSVS